MISNFGRVFSRRILVIDGDHSFQKLIGMGLPLSRYKVSLASHPFDGLEKLSTSPFDLIILEAGRNSAALSSTLADIRQHAGDIRILLTGEYLPASLVLTAVSQGVTTFLNKPTSLTQLRRTVRSILAESSHSMDRAFKFARQLDFHQASDVLKNDRQDPSREHGTWQRVFEALSTQPEVTALNPYRGELLELALSPR